MCVIVMDSRVVNSTLNICVQILVSVLIHSVHLDIHASEALTCIWIWFLWVNASLLS